MSSQNLNNKTQIRSPAMGLRLARCTAWVKRWSEAWIFCKLFSKQISPYPVFDTSYDPIVTESKGMQKTPEFDASYDPVVTESKGMQKTP